MGVRVNLLGFRYEMVGEFTIKANTLPPESAVVAEREK